MQLRMNILIAKMRTCNSAFSRCEAMAAACTASAVGYFAYPEASKEVMSLTAVGSSVFAMGAYLGADAMQMRETQRPMRVL